MSKSLDRFMNDHIGPKQKKNSHNKGHNKIEDKKRKSSEPSSESQSSGAPSTHSFNGQDNDVQYKKRFKEDLERIIEVSNSWSTSSNENHMIEDPAAEINFIKRKVALEKFQLLKDSSENLKKYIDKFNEPNKLCNVYETNTEVLKIVSQLNKHRQKFLQELNQLDKC